MTPDDEDGAVLARSVGEPAAFAAIYERHAGHVLRYVRRRLGDAVAEDATTEVFVRAFKQRGGYVARHPTALPWLLWLAGLVIADQARAERRRLKLIARVAAAGGAAVPQGSGTPASPAVAPDVVRALRRLSPADRETLLLVVWGELSYEEAATAAGVPVGTVRSRIARARRQLRDAIPEAAPAAANPKPGGAHV
ncbi:MAG TPA: RNA polymerase sigma factor [Solirubrobacteraceae bacterium]|jgi:RNA polymerase sigma-70 factor (ECF subfamily)|nr:RNA polymerase sigma factor [Solirubrobacteraceae bacterium]